jgi:hypothetical protein
MSVAARHIAKTRRPESKGSSQPVRVKTTSSISRLQQAAGNRAMHGLLRSNAIQPKLTVSHLGDEYEREADRVADQVMRKPGVQSSVTVQNTVRRVQRACLDCQDELERERAVYAKRSTDVPHETSTDVASYITASQGGGSPLPRDTRVFFENRFGQDLSGVRIHTGNPAAESARAINAKAYTLGSNIVFNAGEYRPDSESGRHLLAHELAHVVQQGASQGPAIQRRTYRSTFTTVAYLPGPLWNVHLTITNSPEDDTQRLDDFIDACHDGIMNAARSLGERPSVTTREIRVRIRFNARADRDVISQQAFDLAIASLPRPTRPVAETRPAEARPTVRHIPRDPSEDPRPGETDDQRIRRQASASLRLLSNVVADAGSEGYNRVVLTLQNDGREIYPGFSKEDRMASRPTTDQTSAYAVHDFLRVYFDHITQGAGRWQIIFTRQGNAMSFSRFERIPETPPRTATSEEEELRALGIPNRREIYARIFEETEHQLQEAGIMIAGFVIEQLILYVAGGVLFKAVGLVGRAAFPKILALISRGTPAALASGLEVLSVAERAEFTALMQRVESGALSAAERTRLTSFLTRIEGALPSTLTRTAANLISRIRIPGVTRLPNASAGSAGAFDAELVRRAAEIRATQAGLTLDAFTNLNVAVARVRTASGEIVYLEAGNLPAGAHSEGYLVSQFRDRATGLGVGARVEQL